MAAAVSPVPRLTFFDNAGAPLNGGLVYTYSAGTLTPKTTYSNEALSTPISNPIVLNSSGRPVASATDATEVNVYLLPASYKFIVKTSGGATLYTADNVEANQAAAGAIIFPATVTGGTSGAIPYFSADTTLSVSALLASRALMIGGGAATAPLTDSNWTITTAHYLNSATQPRCVAYNSTGQTVTAAATTALTLDTNEVNVGSMHSTSVTNTRVIIQTGGDGFYLVTGFASMQASGGSAEASLILEKNGTTPLQQAKYTLAATTNFAAATVTLGLALVATDYLELYGKAATNNVGFGTSNRYDATTLTVTKLW